MKMSVLGDRIEKWLRERMPVAAPGSSRDSIHRHLLTGGLIVLLLAFGVGGWAATTQIAGALIAQGSIVVDSNVKKVQHPTGGVVGKLNVQDGDRVKAGDILVQLDDTVTRANLAIVTKGLDELAARKARLEAERDGADSITFPRLLLAHATEPSVGTALANESKLFELRRSARLGQKAQLKQRITQLRDEIQGLTAQQDAKAREIALIGKELEGVRELWKNNLVQITRLTALERDGARLEGERGQLVASVAQAKGKITETELQVIQIDQDLSSEVAKDMREVDAKFGEFVERKVAAEDQLKRIDIRAPQDGIVLESKIHTVGGVDPRRRRNHADRSGIRQSTWSRLKSIRTTSIKYRSGNRRSCASRLSICVQLRKSMAPSRGFLPTPRRISAPAKTITRPASP